MHENKLQLQKVAIMVRDITNVNLGAKCADSSREQNYMEAGGGKDVPMLKGKWSLYIGCFKNARWGLHSLDFLPCDSRFNAPIYFLKFNFFHHVVSSMILKPVRENHLNFLRCTISGFH